MIVFSELVPIHFPNYILIYLAPLSHPRDKTKLIISRQNHKLHSSSMITAVTHVPQMLHHTIMILD